MSNLALEEEERDRKGWERIALLLHYYRKHLKPTFFDRENQEKWAGHLFKPPFPTCPLQVSPPAANLINGHIGWKNGSHKVGEDCFNRLVNGQHVVKKGFTAIHQARDKGRKHFYLNLGQFHPYTKPCVWQSERADQWEERTLPMPAAHPQELFSWSSSWEQALRRKVFFQEKVAEGTAFCLLRVMGSNFCPSSC